MGNAYFGVWFKLNGFCTLPRKAEARLPDKQHRDKSALQRCVAHSAYILAIANLRKYIVSMLSLSRFAGILLIILISPLSAVPGENQSVFQIDPLRYVSAGFANLVTTYPGKRYIFPNEDGTRADKGLNYYLSAAGGGSVSSYIRFNYEIRANNIEGVRFKKGSVILKTAGVSLEAGRDNIRLGHGRYGSLLLSNNAEPYTLVRFRTERPISIPYIGEFDYTLFHGWPRNFKIIGHMLNWYPVSWLEINVKQTIVYTDSYSFIEYLKMFSGRDANVPGRLGRTDSRSSFGIALDIGFLSHIAPAVTDAKLYAEYGGEDLYAVWQRPDSQFDKNLWVGPFGFELLDTGILTGLQIYTNNSEFFFEYAQNYKNHYLFYDPYNGGRPYNLSWYRHSTQPPFQNDGNIMGHHMGSAAELLALGYTRTFDMLTASVLVSRRHRWNINMGSFDNSYKAGPPERQDSFTGYLNIPYSRYSFSLFLTYNLYRNADEDPDPLVNSPRPGTTAQELITRALVTLYF